MSSESKLDQIISFYSSRFEGINIKENRQDRTVRPLGSFSDSIVDNLGSHYFSIQQGLVDPRDIARLYEVEVAKIPEHNLLTMSLDTKTAQIAHLDGTMAEAVLVSGGVVPPNNLTRLVDNLSELTGFPPIIPYVSYVENVSGDRRLLTGNGYGDEHVGRSEAKFQEIHRLIELHFARVFEAMNSSIEKLVNSNHIKSATDILIETEGQLGQVSDLVLTLFGLPKKDFALFRPPLSSSPIRVMDFAALPIEVAGNLRIMLSGLRPKELIPQDLLKYVAEIQSKGMMTLGGPSGAVSHGVAATTLLLGFGGEAYKNHVRSILPYCSPGDRLILAGLLANGVSLVQASGVVGNPEPLKKAIVQIGRQMKAIRDDHQRIVAFHFENNYENAIGTFGKPVGTFLPEMRRDTSPTI